MLPQEGRPFGNAHLFVRTSLTMCFVGCISVPPHAEFINQGDRAPTRMEAWFCTPTTRERQRIDVTTARIVLFFEISG